MLIETNMETATLSLLLSINSFNGWMQATATKNPTYISKLVIVRPKSTDNGLGIDVRSDFKRTTIPNPRFLI